MYRLERMLRVAFLDLILCAPPELLHLFTDWKFWLDTLRWLAVLGLPIFRRRRRGSLAASRL